MKLHTVVKHTAAALFFTGSLFACYSAIPAAHAATSIAQQQNKPILVYFNGSQLTNPTMKPGIHDGHLLFPLNLIGGISGASVYYDAATQTIQASYESHKGSLRIGEQSGTVDGHRMDFAGKAIRLNNQIYIPARFAVAAIGGTLYWDASNRIAAIVGSQFVTATGKGGQYRLDGTTGDLYYKMKGQPQKLIGKSIAKLNFGYIQMATMSVISIGKDSELITISHAHGEPLINDEEYTIFVRNGSIVQQMHASYWRFAPQNTATAGDLAVMTDGRTVQLVDGDAQIVKTYSLQNLAGIKSDFDIEAVNSEFLLFRSADEGLLYITDIKSGKTTAVHQALGIDPKQLDPFSDGIKFKEQDGNKLYFIVTDKRDGHQEIRTYGLGDSAK